jgi:betaine reductase
MDPENQGRIKQIVDEHGADNVVVMLGAADPEALEVTSETVTEGDPAFVGPLAGVQLGLPVMHIFEDEVKDQVDPAVYEANVGFLEMTLDTASVRETMRRLRERSAG